MTDLQLAADVPVRVVDPSIEPEQVRRFQDVIERVRACGLLVPEHRYVVALDPPRIEMPTEPVQGRPLADALRRREVHPIEMTEALLALLRFGREVLRTGGDLLRGFSLDQFAHGTGAAGTGVYFVDLEPAVVSASGGPFYGQLVAATADLLREVEQVSSWVLSPVRLAVLAICAEIEEADPAQPWTGRLRDAVVEDRPSDWRSWS